MSWLQQRLNFWPRQIPERYHLRAGVDVYILDGCFASRSDGCFHGEVSHLPGILHNQAVDGFVSQTVQKIISRINSDQPNLPGQTRFAQCPEHSIAG